MFAVRSRYHLCDLFDIPIYIDISLVLLLVFFVSGGGTFLDGIAMALMLLVSITAHEFGHALTARSFGCETRDITLSLLGGCASLIALPRKASQEFLTALAGPAVSFALSVAGVVVLAGMVDGGGIIETFDFVWSIVLGSFGINYVPEGSLVLNENASHWAWYMVSYFSIMNSVLGIFNLLPGFPLDGGRVFRSAMRSFMSRAKATYIAMIVGRVVAVAIALSGVWRIANGRGWGVVTLLIAWMIWKEGYREYRLAAMESSWSYGDYRAHVSPPPYGGESEDCDVKRGK